MPKRKNYPKLILAIIMAFGYIADMDNNGIIAGDGCKVIGCSICKKINRCHICGHEFIVGDVYRWIDCREINTMNIVICIDCDGKDVIDRWKAHHDIGMDLYWWMNSIS